MKTKGGLEALDKPRRRAYMRVNATLQALGLFEGLKAEVQHLVEFASTGRRVDLGRSEQRQRIA